MKKILLLLTVFLSWVNCSLSQEISDFSVRNTSKGSLVKGLQNCRMNKISPEEILACSDDAVKTSEIEDFSEGWVGFIASDQSCKYANFYQHFSDCYYTFNSVRFFGLTQFCDEEDNYTWYNCNEHGAIDENGDMTEPIKFEIAFYKEDESGAVGEKYYSELIDIIGDKTGIVLSNGRKSQVYEFMAVLKETVKLESGFLSISAVDVDKQISCWFCLLISDVLPDYSYCMDNGEIIRNSENIPYCLMGTGEFSAQKALKLNRFLGISKYTNDPYQKVSVEIKNVGSGLLNRPNLELWLDGKKIATEQIDVSLESLETYRYTFNQRLDCSQSGEHCIEIRNVTEGDEGFCTPVLKYYTANMQSGEVCHSESQSADYGWITHVQIGSIDNISENSTYSDFTEMETDIYPGDTLEMCVDFEDFGYYPCVYVDWNGDGTFDGEGEFIGIVIKNKIAIAIPDDIDISAGRKRLRIIYSNEEVSPCQIYDFGETEDYTLVVKRPDVSAIIDIPDSYIDEFFDMETSVAERELIIKNNGSERLEGDLSVKYYLPNAPFEARTRLPRPKKDINKILNFSSRMLTAAECSDSFDEECFTIRYDKGVVTAISPLEVDYAIFAHYYPACMLEDLKGMMVSSVDVYINDMPKKCSIKIYSGDSHEGPQKEIYSQDFIPESQTWNKVRLTTPLEINGDDIWIAVKMYGFTTGSYSMGVDNGDELIGYGDWISVDGENWYTMEQMEYNVNFCIRTNISGMRTPAINWLGFLENHITIDPAKEQTVKLIFENKGLSKHLYEAEIIISSNDKLNKLKKIPVYLYLENPSRVDSSFSTDQSSLTYVVENNMIQINSKNKIREVALFDTRGCLLKKVKCNDTYVRLSLDKLEANIGILLISYDRMNSEIVKFLGM